MKRTITITEEEAITLAGAILTRKEFVKKLKGDAGAGEARPQGSEGAAQATLADAGGEKFIRIYDEELHRLDDLLARVRRSRNGRIERPCTIKFRTATRCGCCRIYGEAL